MTFSNRWFVLLALGIAPLLLGLFSPAFLVITPLWCGALLVATFVDYLLLPAPKSFELSREVEPQVSLGAENAVRVLLRNPHSWAWRVTVHDEPPASFPHDFTDSTFVLPAEQRRALTYHILPRKRGDFQFGDLWLRIEGKLGLVNRQRKFPSAQPIKVYPNLLEAAKFTLMARKGRLQHVGIRAARLNGAGSNFESLREYTPDDEYRRIDWKATARRGKLISRQYEVERSQNVIIAIDVGRTMMAEIDGIAKMDYAVNAALLLAYVATLTDDKVGLLVFADGVQTWMPPQKGRAQVYRILDALYNAEARRSESDYHRAFGYLATRWRKRSLVVCFTDLWDPDSSRQTIQELSFLQPRHLVACVSLLDTKVLRRVDAPLNTPGDVYEQGVALQMLDDRARALGELQRRGVLVVDTSADKLSAALVNRYLEVKERMQL